MNVFFRRSLNYMMSQIGITSYNRYLLSALKRPEWIFRPSEKIPFIQLSYVPCPTEQEIAQDMPLCERLITCYKRAMTDYKYSDSVSPIWSENISINYGSLIEALENENPNLLSKQLSSMFMQGFMQGISTGNLYKSSLSKIGAKIWSLKLLDDIISLAEYLGVVRTECPEQGVIGHAFRGGIDKLVEDIEIKLGTSIDFPKIGAPYGIRIKDSLVTMETPEHIYIACKIANAISNYPGCLQDNKKTGLNVLEVGAGFGGTAYWFLKTCNLDVKCYSIIDLPLMNVFQGYFLSKVLGESNVSFFSEINKGSSSYAVRVLPTHAISEARDGIIDVVINQNSMPEMPIQEVMRYISWAKNNMGGIFFSCNQEAFSLVNGTPQVLVPEIFERVGGFRRLSRNYSWLRRGYVEEVYSILPRQ